MSSGFSPGDSTVTSTIEPGLPGPDPEPGAVPGGELGDEPRACGKDGGVSPNIRSKSDKNRENTGAGMLRVGAKTMPTFRTVILLTSELLTTLIRNSERALRSAIFGFGKRWTKVWNAAIFFCLSSRSRSRLAYCTYGIRVNEI